MMDVQSLSASRLLIWMPRILPQCKVHLDALVAFRSQLKEAGVKVSYNDIILRQLREHFVTYPL